MLLCSGKQIAGLFFITPVTSAKSANSESLRRLRYSLCSAVPFVYLWLAFRSTGRDARRVRLPRARPKADRVFGKNPNPVFIVFCHAKGSVLSNRERSMTTEETAMRQRCTERRTKSPPVFVKSEIAKSGIPNALRSVCKIVAPVFHHCEGEIR